jgi:hypothetical protein
MTRIKAGERASAEQGLRLIRAFLRIANPAQREKIIALVARMATASSEARDRASRVHLVVFKDRDQEVQR